MLTVTHGNGWKDVDFEGFGVHWRAFDYAVGDAGPRYPMPAIYPDISLSLREWWYAIEANN